MSEDLPIRDPERALALVYAPRQARAALATLWRLDETLAQVVRTTSEPMIGRMRLTWWHDALLALDEGLPPAEPLLREIAAHLKPHIAPSALAPLIDGWDVLLDDFPIAADALDEHGRLRGAVLFEAAATLLGGGKGLAVGEAGRLWALADLALHVSDAETARRAGEAARALAGGLPKRWPRGLRAIGALAVLARADMIGRRRAPGSPARVGRALLHRFTGR